MEIETLKEQAERIKMETAYEEENICDNCGILIEEGKRFCQKCELEYHIDRNQQ